jgi:predicted dehydrogenase
VKANLTSTKIGVVGCGDISGIYLKNINSFENLELIACCDLDETKANRQAKKFNIPRVCKYDEMLTNMEIDCILNLTLPKVHAQLSQMALDAGKHVYSEKPLAINLADAQKLLETAKARQLRIGCAPDTFLGGAVQAAQKLINEGQIGKPIAATAFMTAVPPETWHPDPEFLYQAGAGPMFDMGPYYLTVLVNLLGNVTRACGTGTTPFSERTITSKPKHGQKIQVETDTFVAGLLEFTSGAVGTIVTSFDTWASEHPHIEIYGTNGTLSLPDPNYFGGKVRIRKSDSKKWQAVPMANKYVDDHRGLGLSQMAEAINSGGSHSANGHTACHILEIMHAILQSKRLGNYIEIENKK